MLNDFQIVFPTSERKVENLAMRDLNTTVMRIAREPHGHDESIKIA